MKYLELKAFLIAILVAGVVVGGFLGTARFVQSNVPTSSSKTTAPSNDPRVALGTKLFGLNCAHCHGIDATGDEGPDLHKVTKSDERIRSMVLSGVKGEMPAFGKKLNDEDVKNLIAFIRSLSK